MRTGSIGGRDATHAAEGTSGAGPSSAVQQTGLQFARRDAPRPVTLQSLMRFNERVMSRPRPPGIALPSTVGRRTYAIRADQAGYLFVRAAQGRHIQGEDLAVLHRGQVALERARDALPHGRGNVVGEPPRAMEHASALRHVTWPRVRDEAMAGLQGHPDPRAVVVGSYAGAAAFMGAGNCGDHGTVGLVALGKLIGRGEQALLMAHTCDHNWAVLSRDHRATDVRPDDVVVDAWAEGPAIMASDGRFWDPGETSVAARLSPRSGRLAATTAEETKQRLAATTTPQMEVHAFYQAYSGSDMQMWTSTPVLDETRASESLTAANEPKNVPSRYGDEKIGLRQQVLAAGVARSLGAGVGDAAKMAPAIVEAAVQLAGWNAGQGHDE